MTNRMVITETLLSDSIFVEPAALVLAASSSGRLRDRTLKNVAGGLRGAQSGEVCTHAGEKSTPEVNYL